MLAGFLLAPAPLRDFMTLRQFTDIFPKAHRTSPAVQDLYRELQRLRDKDIDTVRRDIADEVTRSKQLRREYAKERRRIDGATVAGLDAVAQQMEEEVLSCCPFEDIAQQWLMRLSSFLAKAAGAYTPFSPSTLASTRPVMISRHKSGK